MKKILIAICLMSVMPTLTQCKLDNYDAPDSKIYGSMIDVETGDLVEQDIINGAVIEYLEDGYTQIQNMVIKNDGTYRNNLIFSGKYTMSPVRGNFEPVEPREITLKPGDNSIDFEVKPFVRIKNVNIYHAGEFIKADFTIEQTGYDPLQAVTLFAYTEPNIGQTMAKGYRVDVPVGVWLEHDTTYSLQMKLKATREDPNGLFFPKPGQKWFFRVGAKVAVPADAKYNYAPFQDIDF